MSYRFLNVFTFFHQITNDIMELSSNKKSQTSHSNEEDVFFKVSRFVLDVNSWILG